MKTLRLVTFLTGIALFGLASCQKDDEAVIDSSFAETEATVDDSYNEVDEIVESSLSFFSLGGRIAEGDDDDLIGCAVKSHNMENKSIVIDFGDSCKGPGGRIRSGRMIINYTDRYFMPGAVTTITFEDFFIDDIKVEGTRTRTNITESNLDTPRFEIVTQNGKLTWPDGKTATCESEHTLTWYRALNPLNDESTWEGVSSGTTINGNVYTVSIQGKLRFKRGCWVSRIFMAVEGVKLIQVEGRPDMTIDYGDGDCDRIVTVTVNGVSKTVEVRKRD